MNQAVYSLKKLVLIQKGCGTVLERKLEAATLSLKESYPDAYNQPDSDKLSLIQIVNLLPGKIKRKLSQLKSRKTILRQLYYYDVKTGKCLRYPTSYIFLNNVLQGNPDAMQSV